MTRIQELTKFVTDKSYFVNLGRYSDFCMAFLDFVDQGLQARIVCQNEPRYQFFQYREDCEYNISRPINTDLLGSTATFQKLNRSFRQVFQALKANKIPPDDLRSDFIRAIYTMQQSIGVTLDALPAAMSNQAKKINGDLFERLIRFMLQEANVDCEAGTIQVPVKHDDGTELFRMNYQHDLIIRNNGQVKLLGSVKTSSKDRIDKIFVDKLLFNRLSGTDTPYIAVFLNDVQRVKTKKLNEYRVNSTFLAGHFKAYTVRLVPMDGVFYCDLRPSMQTDPFLSERISTIDRLFFTELKRWVE